MLEIIFHQSEETYDNVKDYLCELANLNIWKFVGQLKLPSIHAS